MTICLRWDHGTTRLSGQSVWFRCRALTRQRGHSWKVVVLGVRVSPKCPSYEWWYLCRRGCYRGEKSVALFWDSMAHLRATQGFCCWWISCASPVVASLHLGQVRAKQKVRGGSAAALRPVTSLMEQIWSSSSVESSSMLSHKALFCQQSERREMGERKKKRKCHSGRENSLINRMEYYDEEPLI